MELSRTFFCRKFFLEAAFATNVVRVGLVLRMYPHLTIFTVAFLCFGITFGITSSPSERRRLRQERRATFLNS